MAEEMTNDQYHDLLDARKAALQDFRYVNVDEGGTRFEVEAYQITPRSRFQTDEWPIWLVMQRAPTQVNAIYCDSTSPNDLVLMKSDGMEQPLGDTDWLVLYKTGDIAAVAAMNFEHFSKVVPVPDKPVVPESAPGFEEQFELDEKNNLIPRKTPLVKDEPVPGLDDLEDQVAPVATAVDDGLTAAIGKAMTFLQDSEPLEVLKDAMSERVHWCNCRPGKCEQTEVMGCRVESPLVR